MPWRALTLDDDVTLFTTAQLTWRPLAADEPQGAQIATLWGDPAGGVFAAVVESPTTPGVYTLVRRDRAQQP